MAITIPRTYLAVAFPAAFLVLTYLWFKKHKEKKPTSNKTDNNSETTESAELIQDIMVEKKVSENGTLLSALELPSKLTCATPIENSSNMPSSIDESDAISSQLVLPVIEKLSLETADVEVQEVIECKTQPELNERIIADVKTDSTDKHDEIECVEKIELNSREDSSTSQIEMPNETNIEDVGKKSCDDDNVDHNKQNDQSEQQIVAAQIQCSDVHSEGSSDSGKGGSEIHASHDNSTNNSQPNSPLNSDPSLVYEFEIPQELCGRLIGRQGKQINQIRIKSRCNIYIRRTPFNDETQICVIEGTQTEIDAALEQIRLVFPLKRYPLVTLAQVNVPMVSGLTIPQTIQLTLPNGVMSDVVLSSMVNAGHFFVQQPTHPTYPSLSQLDQWMLACYQMNTPALPSPIEPGMICAAPMMNGWYRAQIMYVNEETEECSLKFVDYGGYSHAGQSSLRQIRSDFMSLPFQATECYLANVAPIDETEGFSVEACAAFEDLAQGQILQLQIAAYAEDGLPCVSLYRVQGASTVYINDALCQRGVTRWIEDQKS